jgi:hypothetical protein
MSSLVETLKAEHAAVLLMVGQLQIELNATELDKVSQTLTRLKVALLAHLAREDAELYPGLVEMAEKAGDASMARGARAFQDNMKRISEGLVAFLGKYEGKKFDVVAFNRDWKSIVEVLGARITAEETTLYPMYERGSSKPARKG